MGDGGSASHPAHPRTFSVTGPVLHFISTCLSHHRVFFVTTIPVHSSTPSLLLLHVPLKLAVLPALLAPFRPSAPPSALLGLGASGPQSCFQALPRPSEPAAPPQPVNQSAPPWILVSSPPPGTTILPALPGSPVPPAPPWLLHPSGSFIPQAPLWSSRPWLHLGHSSPGLCLGLPVLQRHRVSQSHGLRLDLYISSLGVALSRGHGKYSFRGNVSVEEGDTDLIQEVLFDAVVTAPLEAYWTSLALNKSENSDKGVEIAYLGTRTGLSRINLFVMPDQLTNQARMSILQCPGLKRCPALISLPLRGIIIESSSRSEGKWGLGCFRKTLTMDASFTGWGAALNDFLTAEDKELVFSADHFPLWYKRAAEQVPGTFIYSLSFNKASENKSVVYASSTIHLLDERESPIAAVRVFTNEGDCETEGLDM
ncbi:hypothetical protein PO909_017704 [Leuciscus waleckii]